MKGLKMKALKSLAFNWLLVLVVSFWLLMETFIIIGNSTKSGFSLLENLLTGNGITFALILMLAFINTRMPVDQRLDVFNIQTSEEIPNGEYTFVGKVPLRVDSEEVVIIVEHARLFKVVNLSFRVKSDELPADLKLGNKIKKERQKIVTYNAEGKKVKDIKHVLLVI